MCTYNCLASLHRCQCLTLNSCFTGLVSMPLFTMFLIMGRWPLGRVVCDLYLCLDYTISNASVANLLIICFDR